MNECPNCGENLSCLGGESAHPDNWYCESCDYKAWEARNTCVKTAPKTYAKQELIAVLQEVNDKFSSMHEDDEIYDAHLLKIINSIIERESAK